MVKTTELEIQSREKVCVMGSTRIVEINNVKQSGKTT